MATTYPDLASFRRARDLARSDRDAHAASIKHRWGMLHQRSVRGALFRDAVGDLVRGWKPVRRVMDLAHGRVNGELITAVGELFASTRSSWLKRVMYGGMSRIVGHLIGRLTAPDRS
ncbi:MAG: hypothetical protein IT227_06290 [Flavobacteriales bacterium]|nr:hypothetical protein [Flavobacteriales bacterium]